MQSDVFHVSRSSDGQREWYSARDAASGVSIPCECKDRAIALVTSLNSAFKHHLTTALSDKQAEEVKGSEWHRADRPGGGSVMLYTLREEGRRRGEPVMTNDVMINIDRGTGSSTDIEPIVQRIRSALVDVPAVEPVAWQPRYKQDVIDHHRSIGGDLWEYAMTVYPTKAQAEGYGYGGHEARPLYTSPPLSLREGEDSAEVIEEGAKVLAHWIRYAWDGIPDQDISAEYPDWSYNGIGSLRMQGGKPALRKVAAAILALAATRSASATSASGTEGGK